MKELFYLRLAHNRVLDANRIFGAGRFREESDSKAMILALLFGLIIADVAEPPVAQPCSDLPDESIRVATGARLGDRF